MQRVSSIVRGTGSLFTQPKPDAGAFQKASSIIAGQGHLPLPDDHKPASATATEELNSTSATVAAYVSSALLGNHLQYLRHRKIVRPTRSPSQLLLCSAPVQLCKASCRLFSMQKCFHVAAVVQQAWHVWRSTLSFIWHAGVAAFAPGSATAIFAFAPIVSTQCLRVSC